MPERQEIVTPCHHPGTPVPTPFILASIMATMRESGTSRSPSLSVAPIYLMYKDHKEWQVETGTPPPSRPVVGAGAGQNDHLSEIVSHVLEPIVKMRPGGMEVMSTGDFIARIEGINKF